MGTVNAKSSEKDSSTIVTQENISLDGRKAKVDKVHVDGLGRTKDDVVVNAVKSLFEAENYTQVILGISEVNNRLESLGLFKNVSVLIDTSKGPEASPDGLDITFFVQENRRFAGGVSTLVGNNEGSLVMGMRLPNTFGRGEKVQFEYAHGSKNSTGINTTFTKPFFNTLTDVLWTSALFQQAADVPWSGFMETDRGLLTEATFESAKRVRHNVRWEGVWRELNILPHTKSFAVREEMGHSLKSSLKHTVIIDNRDDMVLPTKGLLFRFHQELAGALGGDIGYLKNEAELQTNLRLPFDCVLQGSINCGTIGRRNNDKDFNITDRYFLGGPMTLRGFETRGAGPHHDGSAMGSDTFWTAAIHLYTPLPFRPGRGGIGDIFRLHFFANAGNLGRFQFNNDYQQFISNLWERRRWAVGSGLAVRIGRIARLEINYCIPMSVEAFDRACHGLQFGLGVQYF